MAVVLVRVASVYASPERGLELTLDVSFWGPEVASNSDMPTVVVPLEGTDSPDVIRAKIVAGVQAEAATRSYTITPADITLPVFQKGA